MGNAVPEQPLGLSVLAIRAHGPCSAQTMQIFKIYEDREMLTSVVMHTAVLPDSTLKSRRSKVWLRLHAWAECLVEWWLHWFTYSLIQLKCLCAWHMQGPEPKARGTHTKKRCSPWTQRACTPLGVRVPIWYGKKSTKLLDQQTWLETCLSHLPSVPLGNIPDVLTLPFLHLHNGYNPRQFHGAWSALLVQVHVRVQETAVAL